MKSRNNKILACIIAPIVTFILLYLMFAFIAAEFDFREWGSPPRVGLILFWLLLTTLAIGTIIDTD
jgi:membrane-bound ClpP family serine protease